MVGFPPKSSIKKWGVPLFSPSILGENPLFLETPIYNIHKSADPTASGGCWKPCSQRWQEPEACNYAPTNLSWYIGPIKAFSPNRKTRHEKKNFKHVPTQRTTGAPKCFNPDSTHNCCRSFIDLGCKTRGEGWKGSALSIFFTLWSTSFFNILDLPVLPIATNFNRLNRLPRDRTKTQKLRGGSDAFITRTKLRVSWGGVKTTFLFILLPRTYIQWFEKGRMRILPF